MKKIILSILVVVIVIGGYFLYNLQKKKSCSKFSGTYGLEAYMASPDTEKCLNNGCEVETIKCYQDNLEPNNTDLGWCDFKCVEK